MLRERHIAKALRIAIDEKFSNPEDKKGFLYTGFLRKRSEIEID